MICYTRLIRSDKFLSEKSRAKHTLERILMLL